MKALINSVAFEKEYKNKHDGSPLYSFKISYDGKEGFYSSKKREQDKFKINQECEFEEIPMQSGNKKWIKLKPVYSNTNFSNFKKAVKKEQSKYSGFAMSYAKDLVCSGHIHINEIFQYAQEMIDWMVTKDKELES